MPTSLTLRRRTGGLALLTAAVALTLIMIFAASADASGGVGPEGTDSSSDATVPGSKAKLVKGRAIPPEDAPKRVQRVIEAANKIRNKPYEYGGGHGDWKDDGYDCSGAASYALHGGGLLDAPIDSSGMARYGTKGKGQWISVYGAPSHGYIVVAGLRFDTAMTKGDGPSWSRDLESTPESYKVRHPKGL